MKQNKTVRCGCIAVNIGVASKYCHFTFKDTCATCKNFRYELHLFKIGSQQSQVWKKNL